MNLNNTLVFIGACNSSWYFNTTPIQRALALRPHYDQVIYVDTQESLSDALNAENSEFIKISSFNQIPSLIKSLDESLNISIIHGPNWRIAKQLLKIRKDTPFYWILDLFDHYNLTSNIHLKNKNLLKFLFHRFYEKNLSKAIAECDLLISAIAEDIDIIHKNKVKCINGVAYEKIKKITSIKDSKANTLDNSILHIGYIGVLNHERAELILKVIKALDQSVSDLRFMFHLIGDTDAEFCKQINNYRSENINIKLYGFVNWEDGIKILNNVDVCLYTFPINNRPELDCVYPIKIGEYLALGKHVLSVTSLGMRDIADKCGANADITLLKESDVQGWVNSLIGLAEYKNQYNYITLYSETNEYLAKTILSWDSMHEQLIKKISR